MDKPNTDLAELRAIIEATRTLKEYGTNQKRPELSLYTVVTSFNRTRTLESLTPQDSRPFIDDEHCFYKIISHGTTECTHSQLCELTEERYYVPQNLVPCLAILTTRAMPRTPLVYATYADFNYKGARYFGRPEIIRAIGCSSFKYPDKQGTEYKKLLMLLERVARLEGCHGITIGNVSVENIRFHEEIGYRDSSVYGNLVECYKVLARPPEEVTTLAGSDWRK